MTPGIPGTGIGGLFYILSALFMPVVELSNRLRNRDRSSPWRQITVQFAIASGILLALAVTAWFILPSSATSSVTETSTIATEIVNASPMSAPDQETNELVKMLFIFGTLGVLLFVLSMVQVLRHVIKQDPDEPTFPAEAVFVISDE